jgi:hypothetical protein
LFADLEAQAAEELRGELAGELADRTRASRAEVALLDRLRAATGGSPVTVTLRGAGVVSGAVRDVGQGWLLVAAGGRGGLSLVLTSSIVSVRGLGRRSTPVTTAAVAGRLPLGTVLRAVARDRSPVRLSLTDGTVLDGTVDEVGQDHLDLAVHPVDEPRRPGAVRESVAVALAALAVLSPAQGTSSLAW